MMKVKGSNGEMFSTKNREKLFGKGSLNKKNREEMNFLQKTTF